MTYALYKKESIRYVLHGDICRRIVLKTSGEFQTLTEREIGSLFIFRPWSTLLAK